MKKTKKKKTKAGDEQFPGKFVLLNKAQDIEEEEVNSVDGAAITAVGSYGSYLVNCCDFLLFRLGTKSEYYQKRLQNLL